jgi:uncharacterized protein YutE (UPF0331/DUF86 family)
MAFDRQKVHAKIQLIVHLYQEVDAEQVYQIVQDELGDFNTFIADVWKIVSRQTGADK